MDTASLLLVLAAAGLHAGWNLVLHQAGDRVPAMAVAGVVGGLLLLPATLLRPPTAALGLVVPSALAQAAYALALSAAYRRGELSFTYPIGRGTAPLLVTLGGWLVLAETPRPLVLAGAVCLGSGLALVADAGRRAGRSLAVGLAVLTGVAVASYSLIDARAVRATNAAGYLGPVLLLQAVVLSAGLKFDRHRLARALGPGLLIGLGSTAAYVLVLIAYSRSRAGSVATVREVAVLLGILLSRDRPGVRVWLGALSVVGGAVLAAA